MEVTITNENIEQYKNGSLPLVVDLWATWAAMPHDSSYRVETCRGIRRQDSCR